MKIQLEIDFTSPKETLKDCIRRTVYGSGRQLKYIAAELDMSPAELSRKLADNPNDVVHFPADRLPDLIRATNSLDIIYWLINEFLRDKEREREQALNQLLDMIPRIKPLIDVIEKGTSDK